jgi:hypothetical protein
MSASTTAAPAFGKRLRGCEADPGTCPRNQSDLVFEGEVHATLPLVFSLTLKVVAVKISGSGLILTP